MPVSITDVKGIGLSTAKLLAKHGIQSADVLAGVNSAQLINVPGFSGVRATQVIRDAQALVQMAGRSGRPKKVPRVLLKKEEEAKKTKKAGKVSKSKKLKQKKKAKKALKGVKDKVKSKKGKKEKVKSKKSKKEKVKSKKGKK